MNTPVTEASPPVIETPLVIKAQVLKPSADAWALGVAGLIPFVGLATGLWLLPPEWIELQAMGMLAYAAVIVSFLGGIHWGLAMLQAKPRRSLLIWGVLPSLLAWAALLLNSVWGLLLMVASLLLCYIVDCLIYRPLQLGGWLGLRALLTGVASVSCLVGVAAFLA